MRKLISLAALGVAAAFSISPLAAQTLRGAVRGAGAPIANSTVTLWAASANAPAKLGQATADAGGKFEIRYKAPAAGAVLYAVATGGKPTVEKAVKEHPGVALLAVLGAKPPERVVINEFSTIASVWTGAQFLDGTQMRGNAVGLRIAAGNVPNFVNLATGEFGGAILDALNSAQSPTMANFGTLANLLAGCIARRTAGACDMLFQAATPPGGAAPTNTLAAAEAIARHSWNNTQQLFALLDQFYPKEPGQFMRPTPSLPTSLRTEQLGAAVAFHRRRRECRGQDDGGQQGECLGRRQLPSRLPEHGRRVERQSHGVRAQRPPAQPGSVGIHRRRDSAASASASLSMRTTTPG